MNFGVYTFICPQEDYKHDKMLPESLQLRTQVGNSNWIIYRRVIQMLFISCYNRLLSLLQSMKATFQSEPP